MLKGLFLNVPKEESSIYESGIMVYNNLTGSDKYTLDYTEAKPGLYIKEHDFYIFNYHFREMGWLDTKRLPPGYNIAVILEMLPDNPFIMTPKDFDNYIILDPTQGFPRALDDITPPPYEEKDVLWVGTFGFLTRGKCYDKVVEAVSKEFDRAVVRINIPDSNRIKMWWLKRQIEKVRGSGITVEITEDYMTQQELVNWCSQNTLNVFLYNRDLPGLAATTDQAIISGRPFAVSGNMTFRHIHEFFDPYPKRNLKDTYCQGSRNKFIKSVWSKEQFRRKFEYDILPLIPTKK